MKICVITVTYNAEAFIERTLQSVACQQLSDDVGTYTAEYSQGRALEVEHLVVDGASTDSTMDIVRRYEYVKWVSEPDSGIYDAMNKSLGMASGDYLVFLNAGDTLHNTVTLARVFEAAKTTPCPAIIYGQTEWVDDDGRFIDMRNHWAPERLTSRSFLRGMLVCHQAFYVLTSIARDMKYDERWRFSADYDWCIRIIRHAEHHKLPMANTGYILANYQAEGMTTHNHATSLRERLYIMAAHYGWIAALWQHLKLVLRF